MTEDLLQLLAHNGVSNPKSASAQEATVRAKNVAVGVESQKVPKCLDGNHSPWYCVFARDEASQIHFKSLPGAAAQLREQFAVIKKISPQDLGNAEDKVPVRDQLDHFPAQPLPKLHHPLLVARWAKMPPLAREG